MIINSPVGRFPYEVRGVTFEEGRIRLEGAMGTWPTSLEVDPAELPGLALRVLGKRRAAALGSAAVLAVLIGARVGR